MLSILIPVYNFKVEKLVRALMKQCNRLSIAYEILVFDDGSKAKIKYENSILSDYFGVNYTELSKNLGRAKIRNWLAKSAYYENLLFLDCDSKIIGNDFIQNYIKHLESYDLVAGGRIYSKKKPRAKSKYLHWLYGKKRESVTLRKRQWNPIMFFHSNNFLVRREVIMRVPFDESLTSYGYEDLLWAKRVNEKAYSIQHIDNPVEHLGLEKNDVFLKKTEVSISNLIRLNNEGQKIDTQLTILAAKLEKYRLKQLVYSFIDKRIDQIEDRLKSPGAKIYQLLLFKLHRYWSNMDETKIE